jgi:RNA polymerase sigma-70 factor (ECF subfamily)
MAERFEQTVMPHLDAAYNLARWLTRNKADAEDVVQEAYLRAIRFFDGFRGGDSRAWILKIVRNTCYSRARKSGGEGSREEFDETVHSSDLDGGRGNAESKLVADEESARVRRALEELPAAYREVLVMREIEGLSYKEIADVMGVPMGTVMSSLSRARQKMREQLAESARKEA